MDSPLLNAPGAVPADAPDAGVAAHYGNPYAEQRAMAAGTGLVDRSHRGVVRITGPDRLSWLHSLTTQDLEHLEPGQSAEALILSPQGHIEHHLTLTDDGDALWAHVEPGTARDAAGLPGVDAVHAPGRAGRRDGRLRGAHGGGPALPDGTVPDGTVPRRHGGGRAWCGRHRPAGRPR